MDSRTLIGMVLMFLVWFYFFMPNPQVPPPEPPKQTISEETAPTVAPTKEAKPADDLALKSFSLSNEKLELEVGAKGEVRRIALRRFTTDVHSKDVVSWSYKDVGSANRLLLQTNLGAPVWKLKNSTSKSIALVSDLGSVKLSRSIELIDDSYILRVTDEILNQSSETLRTDYIAELQHPAPHIGAGGFLALFKPQGDIQEISVFSEKSLWREPMAAFSGEKRDFVLPVDWMGYSYKYFFHGIVPENVSVQNLSISKNEDGNILTKIGLSQKQLVSGERTTYQIGLYFGPKEIPELAKLGNSLDRVIDYGDWIGPISRLLLQVLHFFYGVFANYGIAIILLTLLVKVLLFPLAYKSSVSMRKLSIVQPKMVAIRTKYKDDKQRMQAEMMSLYRDEKVNPVGGCLPLLLQMPVFFALYRVFFSSIELRQTPFVGWIQDLAVHDPYFVTPVLMTALMWGQQKLTPMPPPADDNEAIKIQMAMMKWMPIIFGAIMLFLPAGLTLYFLVNAGLSIIQQLLINRHLDVILPRPRTIAEVSKAG